MLHDIAASEDELYHDIESLTRHGVEHHDVYHSRDPYYGYAQRQSYNLEASHDYDYDRVLHDISASEDELYHDLEASTRHGVEHHDVYHTRDPYYGYAEKLGYNLAHS